jgi:hypothetical protein
MAIVTQAGAWTGLQILGLGDKQRFNSSSVARLLLEDKLKSI